MNRLGRRPASRRLVFATQVVDPEHPALGATVGKLRALAARLDELVVLADSAVPGALPSNCRVVLFGSRSREQRAGRFLRGLQRELAPPPLAFVAHMVPLYALLAAPLLRPRRIPMLLWFTHWKASRTLALAERLATGVLTVDPASFPLRSAKVIPIGHGIDTARFGCVARASDPGRLRVVALGRTSPAKGFEAIVRAAELAGVELEIYGPSSTEEERRERTRLLALGASLKAPVPYSQVDALLAAKDVLVDNMREGALDKVVYEAASTCMPVLASNSGFAELLPPELRFARDDSAELAAKLRSLAAVNRDELGRTLRAKVEARHSVEHWADAVLEAAAR